MNIRDTRKCNLYNLAALACYMDVPKAELLDYFHELLADKTFLKSIN